MGTTNQIRVPGIGDVEVPAGQELEPHLRPLLKSLDERQRFWLDDQQWPKDALGKAFLGRSVMLLGAAMFPKEWTGFEPCVDTNIQAITLSSSTSDLITALDTVPPPAPSPQFGDDGYVPVITRIMSRLSVDDARLQMAKDIRLMTVAELLAPRQRWSHVQARLIQALLNEEVRYFLRDDSTGDFGDAAPGHWWNTEMTAARFHSCKLNSLKPVSEVSEGNGYKWIFVEQADFEKLLTQIRTDNAYSAPRRGNRSFNDEVSVAAMLTLLSNDMSLSPWAAAAQVAPTALGTATEKSKQRRIFEAFKKEHPERVTPRAGVGQ